MSLTVGENTFITVSDADSFWSDLNDSDWSNADQAEKESALRKATVFIDKEYEWPGHIADDTQKLSWPRDNAYDDEGRHLTDIPQAVKDATAYLAGQQVKGNEIFQVRGKDNRIQSLKAGPVEIEYEEHAQAETIFDYLRSILSDITNTSTSQVPLRRV